MKQNSEQMRINKRSYHGNGFEGADLRDFLNGEQDSDHGVLHETEHITPADVPEKHGGPGADDALGLYLKQMGAIALLSRDKEIAVASRLEILRRRYRHAALSNWRVLAHVVETFERVQAGRASLDRTIDVVPSLGLNSQQIGARLSGHLAKLRRLIREANVEFRQMLRARTSTLQRQRLRRAWRGVCAGPSASPRNCRRARNSSISGRRDCVKKPTAWRS